MGNILPRKPLERLGFVENHVGPWAASAVAIGTTAATITSLQTLATQARAAYDAQQLALEQARAATLGYSAAIEVMTRATADVLKQVKAKAAIVGGVGVYELALIPAPATPGPRPAPGKPTDLTVGIDGNGAILLGWKCPNPAGTSGTIYQVWRAVGASEDFAYLGGVGSRKFTDDTVPAGATRLTYRIQAARSTAVGPWATFVVSFGTAGGAATASVEAVKLAA
ncbi:MAG TPA: hypothetical protein VEA69_01230 [Tepidisphaeraceae bacterium]|nr:hypothetical protein [Tepidisphaeraceae bacterium]